MFSRLGTLAAVAALAGVVGLARVARGDDSSDDSSTVVNTDGEFSTYLDSNDVYVYTPAVALGVESPVSGWSANGSYLVDVVSAASVDIVSTATPAWQEVRHAGGASGTYKPSTVGVTAGGSFSREPDYTSLSGGGNVSVELLDKTLTLLGGYTYTHDTAGRRYTPFSVYSLTLQRHTLAAAANVVVNPETALGFTADVILERGHQEKPYRYVPLFDQNVIAEVPPGAPADLVNRLRLPGKVAEALPTERNRYAISGRLAQRLESSTAVFWERVYFDDWGVMASTTDIRFVVDVGKSFYLWPHVRVHAQSGASFWQRTYVATFSTDTGQASLPSRRTGDRELSPLTTFTGGIGARWDLTSSVTNNQYSIVFLGDTAVTRYWDALFIDSRNALFGAIQFMGAFK
jgi:hypothetical protein